MSTKTSLLWKVRVRLKHTAHRTPRCLTITGDQTTAVPGGTRVDFGPFLSALSQDQRVELNGKVSDRGKCVNQDFEDLWFEFAIEKG
jgi:hypothetical protein